MVINLIIIAIALVVIGTLVYMIVRLTAQRDVERTKAENYARQLEVQKTMYEEQAQSQKSIYEQQMKSQLELMKEQMQTTSEKVLKQRQEELGIQNKEQVSKIIDPLQRSLKDMQEALAKTKEQQTEALTRLDETIKINMQKSQAIGETADRLTRALTGEVKVQGNFGELKLKQLLEDLELKEGEQFDTQETLRDKGGKGLKGDQGEKGDKGDKGDAGTIDVVTATVDETVGTPTVSISLGGTPSSRTINFAFSGLKGEQGIQGIQGPSGYVLTDEDIELISEDILARYALADDKRY
jgi:hypothetical protein